MNNMYADRNGKSIDNKENLAVEQVEKLIERQRSEREKTANIVEYYTNGQQRGVRI